jgi:hypothetical protein
MGLVTAPYRSVARVIVSLASDMSASRQAISPEGDFDSRLDNDHFVFVLTRNVFIGAWAPSIPNFSGVRDKSERDQILCNNAFIII